MAYLRYGRKCDWYVFWEATQAQAKDQERLAVWHADHRASGPSLSYAEVREVLERSDFSRIPGFSQTDSELISEALRKFVADVDDDYKSRAG